MNLAEATSFVSRRAAITQEPVVSTADVQAMLAELAIVEDADGNSPTSDDWTETYSRLGCYRVIAEIWTIKAGEVAHRFDFLAPTSGGLFKVSQIQDHCMAQANRYRGYLGESVSNRAN